MAGKIDMLEYKGFPLKRKDNLLILGDMADKYVIMIQVLSTKKVKDLDVADKVSIQLQKTDPDIKTRDRIVKKAEKNSLYVAMDLAVVWLTRALSTKE